MAFEIRNKETISLAREVVEITGETTTVAIAQALKERLARLRQDDDLTMRKAQIEALTMRIRNNTIGPILGEDELFDDHESPTN